MASPVLQRLYPADGITANTKSIAIIVIQSDGAVRVWRAGRMLASFEAPGR
ncbi:MAG: hypothetical protein O6941_00865 [Planctomycetota bacterium]|nr:hypothetical protein [Planctomycetota bacterium]